MKHIGIDFGSKRVGIAVSDDDERIAFPRAVFENNALLVDQIVALVDREDVGAIVLGDSRDYKGARNPIMVDALAFRDALAARVAVPIALHPEVLTSREAMHLQGDNAMNDASAAAIILQSYLDVRNPGRPSPQEDSSEEL